jgi:protein-tyrosine phosphatase
MTPYRICFVCLGNICRSPMAEAVLRQRLERAGLDGAVVVDSAGTGGWHCGEGADHRAVATLGRHGYPTRHVAKQFGRADFAHRDLVLALDRSNLRDLRRLAPTPDDAAKVRLLRSFDPGAAGDGDLEVPDPYYGGDDGFDTVLAMIEAACDGLVAHLHREVLR